MRTQDTKWTVCPALYILKTGSPARKVNSTLKCSHEENRFVLQELQWTVCKVHLPNLKVTRQSMKWRFQDRGDINTTMLASSTPIDN